MALEIQEDCLGLTLKPTLINPNTLEPVDLTTATTIKFRFLSPTEESIAFEEDGNIYGDRINGQVIYTSDASEFDVSGNWKYQVKVSFSGGEVFYSTVSKIKVKANI